MCKRIAYCSRADANRAANQAPRHRVYKCPHCSYWHLSTTPKRTVKQQRRAR